MYFLRTKWSGCLTYGGGVEGGAGRNNLA